MEVDSAKQTFDLDKYKRLMLSFLSCGVCNEMPVKPKRLADCRHTFCLDCISDTRNCPLCNVPFVKKDIKFCAYMSDAITLYDDLCELMNKCNRFGIANKDENTIEHVEIKHKAENVTNLQHEKTNTATKSEFEENPNIDNVARPASTPSEREYKIFKTRNSLARKPNMENTTSPSIILSEKKTRMTRAKKMSEKNDSSATDPLAKLPIKKNQKSQLTLQNNDVECTTKNSSESSEKKTCRAKQISKTNDPDCAIDSLKLLSDKKKQISRTEQTSEKTDYEHNSSIMSEKKTTRSRTRYDSECTVVSPKVSTRSNRTSKSKLEKPNMESIAGTSGDVSESKNKISKINIERNSDPKNISGNINVTPGSTRKQKSRPTHLRPKLIVKTPEREKRNTKGETPLHTACRMNDINKVRTLLEGGANPNVKDYAGWTPLTEAVGKGNLALVELLLRHGAWVNTPAVMNTTPLLEAVIAKNKDIISVLLKHGADVNIRSSLSNTPLSYSEDDKSIHDLLVNFDYTLIKNFPLTVEPPFNSEILPSICCDIMDEQKTDHVFKMCEDLGYEVRSNYWNTATHIVTLTDSDLNSDCTLAVLQGILAGIAIVSVDWLIQCHETKSVVPIDKYEVKGTVNYPNTGVPKLSRINSYKMNPKLFDGCHMSLSVTWSESGTVDYRRKDFISLIQNSGAVYLFRDPDPEEIPEMEKTVMFHSKIPSLFAFVSHVILYQPNNNASKEPQMKYNMFHVKTLPTTWFLKCIQTFSICDP